MRREVFKKESQLAAAAVQVVNWLHYSPSSGVADARRGGGCALTSLAEVGWWSEWWTWFSPIIIAWNAAFAFIVKVTLQSFAALEQAAARVGLHLAHKEEAVGNFSDGEDRQKYSGSIIFSFHSTPLPSLNPSQASLFFRYLVLQLWDNPTTHTWAWWDELWISFITLIIKAMFPSSCPMRQFGAPREEQQKNESLSANDHYFPVCCYLIVSESHGETLRWPACCSRCVRTKKLSLNGKWLLGV